MSGERTLGSRPRGGTSGSHRCTRGRGRGLESRPCEGPNTSSRTSQGIAPALGYIRWTRPRSMSTRGDVRFPPADAPARTRPGIVWRTLQLQDAPDDQARAGGRPAPAGGHAVDDAPGDPARAGVRPEVRPERPAFAGRCAGEDAAGDRPEDAPGRARRSSPHGGTSGSCRRTPGRGRARPRITSARGRSGSHRRTRRQ